MEINEFKDRLFDILNETDELPIQDITINDIENRISIYLKDGTMFVIKFETTGNWWIFSA